jgi:hypothetical protein
MVTCVAVFCTALPPQEIDIPMVSIRHGMGTDSLSGGGKTKRTPLSCLEFLGNSTPLELNTLRVFDLKSLRPFVNSLSQKQWDAVRLIKISVSVMKRMFQEINQFWEKSFTEAPPQEDREGQLLSPFLTFNGLETVVIRLGKNYRHLDVFDHEDWLSHVPKGACEAMIRQLGGRPGLKIEYKR